MNSTATTDQAHAAARDNILGYVNLVKALLDAGKTVYEAVALMGETLGAIGATTDEVIAMFVVALTELAAPRPELPPLTTETASTTLPSDGTVVVAYDVQVLRDHGWESIGHFGDLDAAGGHARQWTGWRAEVPVRRRVIEVTTTSFLRGDCSWIDLTKTHRLVVECMYSPEA